MNQNQRRQFLLSASVLLFSKVAQGQRPERVRSVGVLMGNAETDPEGQVRLAAFKEHLAALGWKEGYNLKTTVGWTAGDVDRASALARELVAAKPDVILASTTPATVALHRETQTIPIVFTVVSDPVGSGLVESLAHPGGNITGLVNVESSLAGKGLELLKEIAPNVSRVATMFNPKTAPYFEYYLRSLKDAAPKFGVTAFAAPVRTESDVEEVISGLGRGRGNGLIVMTDSFMTVHRKSIIALTARNKVPAVYFSSVMPAEGGLVSYGPDVPDLFRRAAPFVDRILRGRNPTDLPVEQPTKFELAVNLKTAKALGITIPQSVLLRADQVIE